MSFFSVHKAQGIILGTNAKRKRSLLLQCGEDTNGAEMTLTVPSVFYMEKEGVEDESPVMPLFCSRNGR